MSITPESVGVLLKSSDFGDRLRAVNHIRQLAPANGFELIQIAMQDTNPRVRYAAVSQLATLGKQNLPHVTTLLRASLHDNDPDVQAAAADSVGALKLTDVFEDLQKLYHKTSEWLVQFSIVATLGELGDERGFALLEAALQSDNELMQTAAIGSLGELGDDRAVQLLVPFATNPDWQIRYRVVQALAHLKGTTAHATLEILAQDSTEQVAQEARNVLKG
ncbi:phycobilisome degradation protein NblB [Stenomitos frigidus]|uniref:Phycocyanin alpha phycocyanobilin lyase n=1 Tax=Stenomitos frigidus ULC18 TaxID=2107698 RepID=A0A2T1ENL9_9CYAN|nr:HEAT repeat domain-containing protein [Stenomitos frigidus]PSB34339.1 phycocyanin alpha phycocyanobilin lyase [Stenomitos frigidus ULC18]